MAASLSLDTCFYFWSNGSLQGGKFCFSSMSGGPTETESIYIEDHRNYAGAQYNGIQIIDTPHGLGTTSCVDPGYLYCAQATFTPNIGAGTFALGYWSDGTDNNAPCYPRTTVTVNAAGNWVIAPLPCGLIPPTCTLSGSHVDPFDAAPVAAWTSRIPLTGPTFSSSAAPGCLELSVPGDQAYDAWTDSGYQADNAPTLTRTDYNTAARSDWVATTRLTLSNAGSGSGGFHSGLVVRFSATKQIFWGFYQSGSNPLILNLEESGQHNLAQVTGVGHTLILGLRYQYAGGQCRYSFGYQQPRDASFTTLTSGITDCSPTASMGLFTKTFAGGRAVTTDFDWFDLVTGPSTANTLGPADATVMANTTCRTVNPVNCATGDFYHTFTDLSIPGRGLPLEVTRTYNSLAAAQDGSFGYGWSGSYNMSLSTDSSGAVTVTQPGGSSVSFTETAPGVYQAPGSVLATLVSSADGSALTFTNHVQERYVFNAPSPGVTGTLRQEIDRNRYVTSFGYSGGRLTSVTDPAGRSLVFGYNTAGRIAQISDPIGRTVVYTYDAAGNLTAVQDVAGGVTRFTYDPAGSHLLLTMTDPRDGVLTNQYDSSGRVVAQTDSMSRTTSFTYSVNPDLSQTTIITDPIGNVTIEHYQDNELLSLTKGYGTAQAATTTYTYDPNTLGITSQTDPDGHTSYSSYDAQGNLLSRSDALGRTTSYAYDALNDVTAITNPLSLTTVMTYDAQGNLVQVARPLTQTGQTALTTLGYDPIHPGDILTQTNPAGHVSHLAYDSYGNLISISDPLSRTTTYSYDLIGRRLTTVSPRGNVAGANPISYTTTMTYDAFGDTTAITDALGHVTTDQYDPDRNLIATTDANGHTTRYGYDLDNERVSVTQPDGGVVSTLYDGDGNAISTTTPLSGTTLYGYDALNRPISTTDPLGRTTLVGYDPAGNAISTTDPLSHTTLFGYDADNERTSVTRPDNGVLRLAYDPNGRVISSTDALMHTTLYAYDALDRLLSTTDPLTRTMVYSYDLAGNLMATTDPNQHTTTYQYDAANERTSVTRADGSVLLSAYDPDGNVISTADPLSHTTLYAYDVLDRLISTTDPLSHTTAYQYDAVGNRLSVTDPLSHTTLSGYDALNRVVTTTDPLGYSTLTAYDLNGNAISTTDALSHTTTYGYDAANEPLTTTLPTGQQQLQGYDANGNETSQTDATGRTTQYGYDPLNRLISTTDPLTRTTVYSYDLADNRIALTDPLNHTTQFGYDAAHELTAITYSDGTTPNVQFTYTPSGQRQTMSDGTGTSSYQYDALDRVITSTNGAGQAVGSRYDLAGHLSNLIYPDGSVITRTYDAANRLTGLTDWAGRRVGYSYDAADRLIQQTYPTTSPLTTTLGYNAANQLTYIVDSVITGTLWAFGYSRDKRGQVNASSDPLDGPTHLYGYTSLNQLAADIQTNGVVTTTTGWGVDAAADITQTLSLPSYTSSALTYDAAHELTSVSVSGTTPLTNTYSYNADGDRTSLSASSGASASYGWDQANRLITATVGSRSSSYVYNGDGVRQSKTISGSSEAYTWDSAEGQPLLLQDGGVRYINGPDGVPVEEVSGTTTLYFVRDQLGSTRGLVTSGGQLAASYSYTPYGSVKAYTGGFYTPFLYAGQYTDGETGFQYLQARYYDPATSQFLSVDPLQNVTSQPYAYTADSPLNGTDPAGLCDVALPLVGRQHVPGTADNHYLCTDVAAQKVLSALNNVDNSDLSHVVYGGVMDILNGAQACAGNLAACAGNLAACAGNLAACAQGTLLLTAYIGTHPLDALAAAERAGISGIATIRDEIACGHYGAAAGHLLLGFVSVAGPGKVFDALKAVAAGGVAATATEGAAAATEGEAAAGEGFFSRLTDQTVGGCSCFPAGTTVATPHGARAIQTLHAGDTVLAEDPATGKVEPETVQAVIDDGVKPLLALSLSDGETITVTADHPFYVDGGALLHGRGWLQAGQLWLGDQLRTADGRDVIVVGIRRNVGYAEVYTLTVSKDHTFFVGTARMLVHNATCGFSTDTAASAYQGMNKGGGHAMRHLIDEGLIPNARSLQSRAATFERLTSPILTNPSKTFDWTVGSTPARAFAGEAGGKQVVVFVAKAGLYQGRIITAVVPDAAQVAQWGLP